IPAPGGRNCRIDSIIATAVHAAGTVHCWFDWPLQVHRTSFVPFAVPWPLASTQRPDCTPVTVPFAFAFHWCLAWPLPSQTPPAGAGPHVPAGGRARQAERRPPGGDRRGRAGAVEQDDRPAAGAGQHLRVHLEPRGVLGDLRALPPERVLVDGDHLAVRQRGA